jgi:hypothetical protein
MVEVPGIGMTQARRVAEIDKMARELIAVVLDVEADDFDVNLRFGEVGAVDDIGAALEAIAHDRNEAAALERRASGRAADLAKSLAASGIPLRDVGTLLGVSFQRAHQLVKA